MSTTIGLKLDDDTRARLQRLGETRDRSPHWLMKTAIVEFLDREERIEQERLEDERRWQHWVETGAHVDHDDMLVWLDQLEARAEHSAQQRASASGELQAPGSAVADERGEWR